MAQWSSLWKACPWSNSWSYGIWLFHNTIYPSTYLQNLSTLNCLHCGIGACVCENMVDEHMVWWACVSCTIKRALSRSFPSVCISPHMLDRTYAIFRYDVLSWQKYPGEGIKFPKCCFYERHNASVLDVGDMSVLTNGKLGARSRHLRYAYVISSQSILCDVITYLCSRYVLLASTSSNVLWCWSGGIHML